jgi:hypothetical protein
MAKPVNYPKLPRKTNKYRASIIERMAADCGIAESANYRSLALGENRNVSH